MDTLTKVIAVTGPPGSGKTTLVEALARRLGDAAVLSMDHYQSMTRLPIEEIKRWFARGADLDELPVGALSEHLTSLKRGRSVVDPATRTAIAPARYVVFETHFGRAHSATGGLIDVLVWLDTPPDVALVRNLQGFLRPLLEPHPQEWMREKLHWIDGYLENYQTVIGGLVRMQSLRVRPGADLVIEPDVALPDAVEQVYRFLGTSGG